MKASELRIGNWVKLDLVGTKNQVTQILEKGINCGSIGVLYEMVKPIPLTEEWLLKFGFKYSDLNGDSGLWKIPPFQIYGKYNQFIYDYRLDVNYVHQLQNLYFALTGEELNQNKEDE